MKLREDYVKWLAPSCFLYIINKFCASNETISRIRNKLSIWYFGFPISVSLQRSLFSLMKFSNCHLSARSHSFSHNRVNRANKCCDVAFCMCRCRTPDVPKWMFHSGILARKTEKLWKPINCFLLCVS